MKHKSFLWLLTLCLSWHTALLPSLVAGTLVKTPRGLVPIEQLHTGDIVLSYGNSKLLKEIRILNIEKDELELMVLITTKKGSFLASKDQFFYDPIYLRWIRAEDITTDTIFMDCDYQTCPCLDIVPIKKPMMIYKITVEFPHALFISDAQIMTHN